MEANFWHQKWEKNEIGFHQTKPNALLAKYFGTLSLAKDARVFLPLCGKTLDIAWFLSEGYRVAGAELSETAIKQLFAELGLSAKVTDAGPLKHYSAKDIDIFAGDIFDLSADTLGPVDAVYDRAALVALPVDIRASYAKHIAKITERAPQFLITFVYDQSVMAGPPFSIERTDLDRYYGQSHELTLLETANIEGGLKGRCPADELAWRLKPAR